MKFDQNGWARAASAFEEVSGAVGAANSAASAGIGGGGTQTDQAISAAVGKLAGLADQAISGLAAGLSADAAAMHRTSSDYQKTEQQGVALGARLAKGM